MDNIAISLGKRQLVDSIWKSANIEGLGTTFPSTQAILDNLPVMTRTEEVYFICNMKRAWEFLFDNIEYPNNLMLLRELNKISMQNLIYTPGEIRNIPVSIGGTTWQPAMPNSAQIIEDIEKINQQEDKLEVALDMFCYIARAQMFLDGNKRVAQLMTNKILMEHDIGILSIPVNKITTFTQLLVDFYETNDNNKLKDFLKEECLMYSHERTQTREVDADEIEL